MLVLRGVAAAAALLWAGPAVAAEMVFEGRVEAVLVGEISTELNGIVAEVLFVGGETVAEGQPLIQVDRAAFEIALAAAQARVAAAEARLEVALDESGRAATLGERGVSSRAVVVRAAAEEAVARADLALARAEERKAALDLERTVIRAPLAGQISRPTFAVGRFLEAEAGPPLATIVQLDPVLIAYRVPYGDRLRAMEEAGAESVEELLAGVTVAVALPGGRAVEGTARPRFASADVDPATGELTIWAEMVNPDGVLRPGMAVTVASTVPAAGGAR